MPVLLASMSRRRPFAARAEQANHQPRRLRTECGSGKHMESACSRAEYQRSHRRQAFKPQPHLQQHRKEERNGQKRPATHPETELRLSKKPKAKCLHHSNLNSEPVAARKHSAYRSYNGDSAPPVTEHIRDSTDDRPSAKLKNIDTRTLDVNAHATQNFLPLPEGKRSSRAPASHGRLAIRGPRVDEVVEDAKSATNSAFTSRKIPVSSAAPRKRQRKQLVKAVLLLGFSLPGGPQHLVHGTEPVLHDLEASVYEGKLSPNQQMSGTGGESLSSALQISIAGIQKLGRLRGHILEHVLRRAIVSDPAIAARSSFLRPLILHDLLAQAEKNGNAGRGGEVSWQIGIVTSLSHPDGGNGNMLRAAIIPPYPMPAAGGLRTLWLYRSLSEDLQESWRGFEIDSSV